MTPPNGHWSGYVTKEWVIRVLVAIVMMAANGFNESINARFDRLDERLGRLEERLNQADIDRTSDQLAMWKMIYQALGGGSRTERDIVP